MYKKASTAIEARKRLPEQLKKAISSSMILMKNFTPGDEFLRLKSRLLAGCDQQDRALNEDVSSSTASITVIFIMLTIAAAGYRHVVTMDIAVAYLYASTLSIVVCMYFKPALATMHCEPVPEYKKYIVKHRRIVVQLDKALSGCIESVKIWYQHL